MNEIFKSAGDQFRQKLPQLTQNQEVRMCMIFSLKHYVVLDYYLKHVINPFFIFLPQRLQDYTVNL